ncbi:hypothetical protein [uncultured Tateyamaria sp.]|uniref:hypothetical protein n=1 Tax=uncultured Tateyamaria sp. TaxID=455651 RepID=UPI0026375356|nr:hypothetical protein [uncultured Tateyamaria sp.]
MEPRRALTTTVHRPQRHFSTWCHYHLRFFDIILLWADDAEDLAALSPLANERIVLRQGAQIPHVSRLTQTLLRQDANTNAALEDCQRRQMDWLLHIDDDELFRPLDPQLWDQNPEVSQLHFVNHEACPLWSADNPFSAIRHFKKSGRLPFILYEGGKSAVRCKIGARADGPHRFSLAEGAGFVSRGAEILHYGCYSYETWLRKYLNLGDFSDWYLDDFRTPITKRFHLESRNIIQDCLATGDFGPSESYFRQVVWDDEELLQGRLRGDLLCISDVDVANPSAVNTELT